MKILGGALGALLAFAGGAAVAQSTPFPGAQGAVITKTSTNDVIAFFQRAGLAAQMIAEEADGTKTIEVGGGGDTAYIAMRGCDGQGAAARCEVVQPYGFFNASGVTYDQINNFNLSASAIAVAGLLPDGRGVLGSKIYLNGGVTFANVEYELAVYFADISRLLQAIKPGVIAEVNWNQSPVDGGAVGSPPLKSRDETHVNAVGAGRMGLLTDEMREILSQGAPISE